MCWLLLCRTRCRLLSNVSKNTKASSDAFSTTFGNYDRAGVNEVSLAYNNGPANVMFSQQKQKGQDLSQLNASAGVLVNSTLNTLGANYNFGALTAYGMYQTSKAETTSATTVDSKYYSLGAKYTIGQIDLLAQVGQLKNNASTSNGQKSNLTGLGVDYNLSKRTALYARYENIADKNGYVANPTALTAVSGETTRVRSAFGVRHSF